MIKKAIIIIKNENPYAEAIWLSLCKIRKKYSINSGIQFERHNLKERVSREFFIKRATKMACEIFSLALTNEEARETGLIPSPVLLSKPKHVQLAELASWLKMYEEEWRNIETSTHREIVMGNVDSSDMNIKAGEIKLAIMAIRKYISDLMENMHAQQYELHLHIP